MIKRVEKTAGTARKTKKRWTGGMLGALMLLCAVSAAYVTGARGAEVLARKRELPVYCVERDDNRIAISFDAAWGGDKTEKILDILDEYGVKTTFFMVDIWTQKYLHEEKWGKTLRFAAWSTEIYLKAGPSTLQIVDLTALIHLRTS